MLLAVTALVLSLLQQIEEASHAEPRVFQVETLLQTAALLPAGAERQAMIAAALNAGVPQERPNSPALFKTRNRCADSRSVLLGMQPLKMQSPPISLPPSITAVLSPRPPAVRAAAYPALPPPITAKS